MDFYTAIVFLTIAMMTVTCMDIASNRLIGKNMKQESIITCILIGLALIFEWAGVKIDGADASLIWLHKLVKLLEFCLAPLIATVAAVSYSKVRHPKIIASVMAVHTVFEMAALHFGGVIRVDDANIYHRGPLYPIYIAVFSLSILYCVVCVVKADLRHYSKPSAILLATLIFLMLGIGFQMVKSEIRTVYMAVAISNYFFYTHRCTMILQLDGLTHLLNRRCFEKDIEKMKPPVRLLLIDVDNFKGLNDTYGHIFGDTCLKEISAMIESVFRKYGVCYRYGGDEFCVILTKRSQDPGELIRALTERIDRRRGEDPRFPGVCIGDSGAWTQGEHILDTIETADHMLYRAKSEKKSNSYPNP